MAEQLETAAFGSDKGGVGKSLAASLRISKHFLDTGKLPVIIEVESDPRLSRVYGEDAVKLFRVGQDKLSDIEKDPSLIYRLWNQIGDVCMKAKAPVVLDIGANLTRTFALWLNEYGEDGPWGTGAKLSFYGVTTGDDMAVQSVNRALSYMAQAVPDSRRFLIINERDEARFPLASDGPAVSRIVKDNGVVGVLRMPVNISPGFAHVVDRHMRLDEAVLMTPEQWQKACGFTRMEAVRAHRRMVSFVDDGIRAFGSVPEAVPA